MNKHLRNFLLRGMMFSGLGPVVVGIVYAILENTLSDFSLTGTQVCLAIISTYILAFLQAGATVFNRIEEWGISKSLLCHFSTVYIAYILCYLLNSWIPFKIEVILIFTLIFIVIYFIIWLSVYLSVKAISRKFNAEIN